MDRDLIKVGIVVLFIVLTQTFSELFLVKNNIYYIISWLDIPMHIFGGFLFGLFYVYWTRYKHKNSNKDSYVNTLIFVLIVGVLWEIYEYYNFLYRGFVWGGAIDTIKDLFNDLLGASIAFFITKKVSIQK